ncbi:MAG: hypothetical protein WBW61_13600 [Rhodanobacteraceae bacterium]
MQSRRLQLLSRLTLVATLIFTASGANGGVAADRGEGASRWTAWRQHEALDDKSLFKGLDWRDIGPVVQGGRVVEVASVPGKPYTFYVAYATGGVWKTANNGVSFKPLSDRLPTLATGAIAVDPNHPSTLWVGTGEANSSRSSYGGMGLFRSDDGGKTFAPSGLDQSDRIARIAIDPKDSGTVYVAALGKLYSEGGQRGVYRTHDGGKSWQQILKGDTPWTGAVDLALDPRDPNVIYAALWDRERHAWNFREAGKGSGLYKSSDGGDHWTRMTDGFPTHDKVGRIGIAIAPSRPDTIYASVDNWQELPPNQQDLGDRPLTAKRLKTMSKEEFLRQDPDEVETFIRNYDLPTSIDAKKLTEMVKSDRITPAGLAAKLDEAEHALFDSDVKQLEIYRSDDAGTSWRKTNSTPLREVNYTYGYYFGQVRVAPDDPDHVYAEGLPLIESTDGGKNWQGLNGPNVHGDYHELMIDSNDPKRMIAGNDGGIDVTYDGGKTWLKLDAQPVGQFYQITYDMADPYNVCGGLQDNGSYKGSSRTKWRQGQHWTEVGGGDGMYCAIDTRDNKTIYTGYQFGHYRRNGPGGKHEVRPRPLTFDDPTLRYNWESPVILSQHNQDVVYFGTDRLYRSLDQGDAWQPISPDLTTTRKRGDVPYGTITTLSESPKQFGLLWVGTDDGHVWLSTDAGGRWKDFADQLPRRWVSRVEASHFDSARAYVSLNGYRDDDDGAYLYRTDDSGRHWTDIGKDLPAEPINVVREDTVNPDVLYVGTDRGVYVSLDRGATWQGLQSNLPNVPVHDLAVHPRERELIAATHGRSAWIIDVLPVQELTPAVQNEDVKMFPVEDVRSDRDWHSRPSLWFDETPYLPTLDGAYWAKASGDATLVVLDGDKRPLREIKLAAKRGVNRYQWDLLVDRDLALAAERARLVKDKAGIEPILSKTPYAEAVRLGQRLYVEPGKYTLKLSSGSASSETVFKVKAPEARKPRAQPKLKIRGEGKSTLPAAATEPDSISGEPQHKGRERWRESI